MGYYESAIARALVLTLFIPLVISSGGNSGSQASTLVIRAMAMEEVRLRDWWRVLRREFAAGLMLGLILGAIGLLRVLLWPGRVITSYSIHYTKLYELIGNITATELFLHHSLPSGTVPINHFSYPARKNHLSSPSHLDRQRSRRHC